MTTRQHPIVKLNGNEYIKFDLSNWGFPGVFAIATEDEVFHQTGYAAIKDGEVWREGQYVMEASDLELTGATWTEPENLLDIWASHDLPTNVRQPESDVDSLDDMSIEELLQALRDVLAQEHPSEDKSAA